MTLLKRLIPLLLALSCVAAGGAGCGTRTVYVAPGEPVRLRETVRDAKVWVLDEHGEPVAGRMDLPEGWYALPVPKEDAQELDGDFRSN